MTRVALAPLREVLGRSSFCHIATSTPRGPHVTPVVFSVAADRMWVTTSRGSVKARAWRRDPRVAGLVRAGTEEAVFTGTVTTYDLLDPESWGRSVHEGLIIALAAGRFVRKNARFFAGYAVDAGQVPLAWTPPGRVFAELLVERSAVVEAGRVVGAWGVWGDDAPSLERFRAIRTGEGPLDRLPGDVRGELGTAGIGALALETPDGPVALPARWAVDGTGLYAVLSAKLLALAGADATPSVALQVDRPSRWRARDMVGAMVRGDGEIAITGRLASGDRSASRVAELGGIEPVGAAVVRIRPRSLVWWRGWSSGTVQVP